MYLVSFLPFLLINGVLTGSFIKSPIVNYNSNEIIGFRIFTIPIEDSVYNLLMLLIVVSLFEKFRAHGPLKN
jgi:lycopene cyclase domain-containing protein